MNSNYQVLIGDCVESMRQLEAGSVQCCVTSPPYFGLRDYGHDGQIGLEQTPDEFVAALVRVFDEVHRVLSDDGTLWLNLGDSYGATGGDTHTGFNERWSNTGGAGSKQDLMLSGLSGRKHQTGLRPKNLLGIPWRVAFALQSAGWYLRQDIIWHKPNPMPESVRDRCTKAHEYIFLLSKSPKYYYDHEAIKEPLADASIKRGRVKLGGKKGEAYTPKETDPNFRNGNEQWGREMDFSNGGKRNKRSVWTVTTKPYKGAHFATFPPDLIEPCILAGTLPVGAYEPDDLILSPAGQGEREDDPSMVVGRAGWGRPRREIENVRPMSRKEQAAYAEQLRSSPHKKAMIEQAGGESTFAHYARTDRSGARAIPETLLCRWIAAGWINRVEIPPQLSALHRSVVLDPFGGSGTTAGVAVKHNRQAIICELNPDYAALIPDRVAAIAPQSNQINIF